MSIENIKPFASCEFSKKCLCKCEGKNNNRPTEFRCVLRREFFSGSFIR